MIDLMIIIGGFLGTVLDPFNIILLILLVIFAKNEKTKERNFLKNLGIVFLMGFGFRLLFIPLNIYASSLDYQYFGIDTAFCILFSNAIFAVLIYLIFVLLYPTLKLCFMTPEEIGAYKKIKTCNKDLNEKAQIKNLIEKYENAKDFECADFLYRLMMFRDKNYTAVQIQTFLNPNENIQIVEEFLLKNLRTKMKLQKLINPTNNTAFVWYYTLNSYITNENKELVNKLWQQLNRGFELAKNKYLLDSSKIFNFDNKEFYQIPKGIDVISEISLEKIRGMNEKDIGKINDNKYLSRVGDLVCVEKIEENATLIQEKENISWNEALYFSINSLYTLLSTRKDINKRKLFEKLDFIVKMKYPQIDVVYKKYLINKFNFVEHIALNAKKIRESENKDWKESTYLAITLLYDDLVSNGNKKGLENLMVVVKNIYPDLTDDIITYGT